MKKINSKIINWIISFLINRLIIFKTNKYTLEKILISTEILQKLPLFLILYFLYNLPLLEKFNLEPNIHLIRFVDNIAILINGNTTKNNNTNLLDLYKHICKP